MLTSLPDPQGFSHDRLAEWVEGKARVLNGAQYSPASIASCAPCELPFVKPHPCGAEASEHWRRFFLATLLADWACYEAPADRADYARLKYILTSAYRFFRVWVCELPGGDMLPVGYTGWYPVAKFTFDALRQDASQIDDRGVFMPLRHVDDADIRHVYGFNISIVRPLNGTVASARMIRAYRRDAQKLSKAGIAAIAVGKQGEKLAKILGLDTTGIARVQGMTETLYMSR